MAVLPGWRIRIRWIVIRNRLTDPNTGSDVHRHLNVISWSLGHRHTLVLHKISSTSVGNFFDNSVNADFGLRTPGSGDPDRDPDRHQN